MTLKRTTSTAAIRDVLERGGHLDEAPARRQLTTRLRAHLMGVVPRRRRGVTRRSLLAIAAAGSVAPALTSDDAIAGQFRATWASWYGPGLWGNTLGCGGTLWQETVGVAHKTLGCGDRLRLCAQSCATVRVIDRGPFIAGREFDLTQALARRVGLRVGPRGAGRVFVRPAR